MNVARPGRNEFVSGRFGEPHTQNYGPSGVVHVAQAGLRRHQSRAARFAARDRVFPYASSLSTVERLKMRPSEE